MVRDTEFELFLNSAGIPQEYIDDIVNINIETVDLYMQAVCQIL